MTTEIALTLAIMLMAIIFFATEKLRVDLVALLVLIAVSVTGLVSKEDVFLGFANSAVITIWAVYIVSGGLFKTGVADAIGSVILRLSGASEARLIFVIMLVSWRKDDHHRTARQYPGPGNPDLPWAGRIWFF